LFAPVVDALRYCAAEDRPKRALLTAVIVGTILTLINQVDVIVSGEATLATYLKCAGNYLTPFIVANVGMLIGRGGPPDEEPGAGAAGQADPPVPVMTDADGNRRVLV
jgi:hypothetical protein